MKEESNNRGYEAENNVLRHNTASKASNFIINSGTSGQKTIFYTLVASDFLIIYKTLSMFSHKIVC